MASAKLRALAVTGSKRVTAAPIVPTMVEAGYPRVEMTIVNALFAPTGTPTVIIDRLNAAVARIAQNPEVRHSLEAQGNAAASTTPAELARMFTEDMTKWAKVAREASIHVE